MEIRVKGRTIESGYAEIGTRGENGVEEIQFVIDRYASSGIDLSSELAYVLFQLPDGTEGYTAITEKYRETGKETLTLGWLVGSEVTAQTGSLEVALKVSGLDGKLWSSKPQTFNIANTLDVETPQPVSFRSRAVMALADPPALTAANTDTEPPITVSERALNIPSELQNIAVQNDQNSMSAAIICPRFFDENDLSKYSFYLRTVNRDGGYDPIPLFPLVMENELRMEWILKPPQTSYSGKLTIQLWMTGADFDWQTAQATVNILNQLGGEPVVPVAPPVFDEFLQQVSEIANAAKESKTSAEASAKQADTSAKSASDSARTASASTASAKSSEENAKKSETSAAGSLTDINSGLAGKLPIAQANTLFQDVTYDESNGTFTFVRYDGTALAIDTRLEQVVVNFRIDEKTLELVLTLADGTEQRVSIASFMNVYTGGESTTVLVRINQEQITAEVRGSSIGYNLLSPELQGTVDGKVTAHAANNASQIVFADGETMQGKLDSGALSGRDGMSVPVDGMYYMRVDEFGHLKIGVMDSAAAPPLSIRDGHLVYTMIRRSRRSMG